MVFFYIYIPGLKFLIKSIHFAIECIQLGYVTDAYIGHSMNT